MRAKQQTNSSSNTSTLRAIKQLTFTMATMVTFAVALHSPISMAADNFSHVQEPGINRLATQIQQPISQLEYHAQQGKTSAQFKLAYAYLHGKGVAKDQQKAIHWLQQAADNGLGMAKYKLALMYQFGEGLDPDLTKAAQLHLSAAKQGNYGAQHSIGMMYAEGKGVERDLVNAYAWLALAANNGYKEVAVLRDKVAKRLNDENMALARVRLEQLKHGNEQDIRLAQVN